MDVLQNSKDYLIQSLELAHLADEYGNHDKDKAKNKSKIKWKLSFICIVQALELLCKKCLSDINLKLVYKDIDLKTSDLNRLINFGEIRFNKDDIRVIEKSVRLRNDFVHYNVQLHTEELKTLFYRLLKIYTEIYIEFIDKKFYLNSNNSRGYGNFMYYADHLVPYRGSEINKEHLQEEIDNVKENQKYHYYIKNGKRFKRVVYGTEIEKFPELFIEGRGTAVYDYNHCDDCLAKKRRVSWVFL